MTRQDFIDSVTSWQALLDFCYEYDCNVCEDIVAGSDLRDCIAEYFENFARDYSWVDIRDWLNRIDEDADYYYRDGSFEYSSVDADFEDYKSDVLDWCDEDATIFHEEDDSDEYEDEESDEDLSIDESDFTIDELLTMSSF